MLVKGDTCALQADAGTCDGNVTRWFFNKETKRCEQFLYTGCNGNRNNFLKLSDCLNLCGKHSMVYPFDA